MTFEEQLYLILPAASVSGLLQPPALKPDNVLTVPMIAEADEGCVGCQLPEGVVVLAKVSRVPFETPPDPRRLLWFGPVENTPYSTHEPRFTLIVPMIEGAAAPIARISPPVTLIVGLLATMLHCSREWAQTLLAEVELGGRNERK